jgi:hypothetical protein
MKKPSKHRKRVENAKNFMGKNKIFTAITAIIVIVAIVNIIGRGSILPPSEIESAQEIVGEENALQDEPEEAEEETWRFYWIDVIILVLAGGFCVAMIIRERRKANDDI